MSVTGTLGYSEGANVFGQLASPMSRSGSMPNNRLQRPALRAAAEPERCAALVAF